MANLNPKKTSNVIIKGGEAEITVKKSRFIAEVVPALTESDALLFLESRKKKYRDASHHCFAYVTGGYPTVKRCGDDGEPHGTAGRPILDVLLGEDLTGAVSVVTRYFGGTLLGTGGLIRAYRDAAKEAVAACDIRQARSARRLKVRVPYPALAAARSVFAAYRLKPLSEDYGGEVLFDISVDDEDASGFISRLNGAAAGKCDIAEAGTCFVIDK